MSSPVLMAPDQTVVEGPLRFPRRFGRGFLGLHRAPVGFGTRILRFFPGQAGSPAAPVQIGNRPPRLLELVRETSCLVRFRTASPGDLLQLVDQLANGPATG